VQGVEEDAEGEREETLRDPLGEAARCLGEVPLEPVGCINSVSCCRDFVFVDESAEQVLASDRCR
jgi:hypothetical protein